MCVLGIQYVVVGVDCFLPMLWLLAYLVFVVVCGVFVCFGGFV